uniref:WAT1-related protein At5g64700-like n=1 Tax=Nicotiana sylvestris TaxID=4096 RepID=A0A1U7X8Q5_NICSY|nr:PREDICTED: WAT1-related protein At5g64700-like [Nicotiana sylvestris]
MDTTLHHMRCTCDAQDACVTNKMHTKLSRVFSHKYSTTLYICMIATLLSVIIGPCMDRSMTSWKVGFNLQLISIIYEARVFIC